MEVSEFFSYKNWVVVGDVLNESKYASRIYHKFKNSGYNVAGVNPREKSDELYKSLREVPFKIEAIDLCINPTLGINIVKEARELSIDKILIQPGAESKEILDYCRSNKINAIENCALVQLSSQFTMHNSQ